MVGLNSRATMDMDATIKGYPVNNETIQKMIEEILAVPVDDNISFEFRTIGEIREGDEYTGYRVHLTANYEKMAVPLKLDITTGDKITPREIEYEYKLMEKAGFRMNGRTKIYGTDCTFVDVGIAEAFGVEAELANKSRQSDIRFYGEDINKGNWFFRKFILEPDTKNSIERYEKNLNR